MGIHDYDEGFLSDSADAEKALFSDTDWVFTEPTDSDIPDWEDTDGDVWRMKGDRWYMAATPGIAVYEPRWQYIDEGNRRYYEWWELKDNGFLPFKPADNH